jgi:murein DD-endopeptidase MepM/ murein hydrolase activator NlpD
MEGRYYVVKQDDSLWGIARHFGVKVDALAAHNNLFGKRANHISIGQKIYLPDSGHSSPDLILSLRVTGLSGKPIKGAKLKLTHDGKTTETRTDHNGWLHGLHIFDHVQGLKVEVETYDRQWRTIFDEKILPLGAKVLHINSLTELVKGRTVREDGPTLVPKKRIGEEIKKQTPQPAPTTTPKAPLPSVPAEPIVKDTRTDNGTPVTTIAPVFTSENLLLPKANEKFRQALIDTAKRYGFTPHALAAIVNAEAAREKSDPSAWKEDSACDGSSARGLGQFLPPAWYQYIAKPGTLGNAEALKLLGATKLHAEYGKLYKIDGGNKTEVNALRLNTILSWRDHGGYAIDAIASYAEDNLALLKDKGIDATSLPPDEKAKIAYIMHHEGSRDGPLYLQGKLGRTTESKPAKVQDKLATQFRTKKSDGTKEAKALADRFGGDYVKAYYYYLASYTETKIRSKNFMLNQVGFSERSSYDVIFQVAGIKIEIPSAPDTRRAKSPQTSNPAPATQSVEVGPETRVGGAPGWSNPLDKCTIRVGGYSDSEINPESARAKSSFLGRNNRHKGIDLCALPGTPIKAVANGEIIYTGSGGTYGNVILLKVDIHDLPQKQREYVDKIPAVEHNCIYFMYAHLSEISILKRGKENPCVHAGQLIGKTGDTGNAQGMTEVGPYRAMKYGAHLHFEARRCPSLKKGEGKWFDPKPLIEHCN